MSCKIRTTLIIGLCFIAINIGAGIAGYKMLASIDLSTETRDMFDNIDTRIQELEKELKEANIKNTELINRLQKNKLQFESYVEKNKNHVVRSNDRVSLIGGKLAERDAIIKKQQVYINKQNQLIKQLKQQLKNEKSLLIPSVSRVFLRYNNETLVLYG